SARCSRALSTARRASSSPTSTARRSHEASSISTSSGTMRAPMSSRSASTLRRSSRREKRDTVQGAYVQDILEAIEYYVDHLTWPFAVAIGVVAMSLPALYAASGKSQGLGPRRVLTAYALIFFASLFVLWVLGIVLSQTAPAIFQAWRNDSNSAG